MVGGKVYCLLSRTELEEMLESLEISEYFIEIDMKGAMTLAISPKFANFIEEIEIEIEIARVDSKRTPDDIYEIKDIFYPLVKIYVEDEEDKEVDFWLKEHKFLEAKYYQKLNTWANPTKLPERNPLGPKRVALY